MGLELEVSTTTDIDDRDDRDDREKGHLLSSKILYVDNDASAGDTARTEVGHISAYRISGEADELFYWADNASQDLHFAVEWLRRQEGGLPETALASGCLYLSNVWVEPAWHGQRLVLKAVATFLELFARNSFVFLRPFPYDAPNDITEYKRQVERLRLLWQRLGLTHYDPNENILWEPDWYCPESLVGRAGILSIC